MGDGYAGAATLELSLVGSRRESPPSFPTRFVVVGPGTVMVAGEPQIIFVSYALRSRAAIAVYDPSTGIGGMANCYLGARSRNNDVSISAALGVLLDSVSNGSTAIEGLRATIVGSTALGPEAAERCSEEPAAGLSGP